MPLPVYPDPLSQRALAAVKRELEEVGVAVLLIGTTRVKLNELGGYVDPIIETLVGLRPEVRTARAELRRAVHNMRRSRLDGGRAFRAIEATTKKVKAVKDLVQKKRLGRVPASWTVQGLEVVNTWGYTEHEILAFRGALRDVVVNLSALGIKLDSDLVVDLNPLETKTLMNYDLRSGSFVADPSALPTFGERGLYSAFAIKLWQESLEARDFEVWGRTEADKRAFRDAFAMWAMGRVTDSETSTKMRVTLSHVVQRRSAA